MIRLAAFVLLGLTAFSFGSSLPRRGVLGIPFQPVPEDLRTKLKLGPQEAVQAASDANGLKAGDLVVGVSGKRFKTFAEWNDLVRAAAGGEKVRLIVRRDGKDEEVEVLFKPKPVDSTDSYETVYDDVVSGGHRIRTLITHPRSEGRHPVLFWIQGINTSSVDFPLSTNNYIANALRPFAEDGYVTVRIEKPGVGDSEGGPAALVGFDEELDIYRQALKSLSRYAFVDSSRVFIFGHSMGGCHAPLLASEIPVKGIITYGTVSNSWLEWEIRSPRIQGPLAGQSRAEVDQQVRQVTAFFHYLYNEKRSVAWIQKNRPELRALAKEISPDGVMLNPRSIKYMQEVNDKNFCSYWSRVGDAHVLALFGENDWISLREDQTQVCDAVNAARAGFGTFTVVPGSDHLFSKCTSMKDSYDRFGKPGTEFNPALVGIIKSWIKSLG